MYNSVYRDVGKSERNVIAEAFHWCARETNMASTNIRVDPRTHAALRELSEQQHRTIGK